MDNLDDLFRPGLTLPVIQYLRPSGRTKTLEVEMTNMEAYTKGKKILDAGFRFEAEVLTTGDVSITITDEDEGDLAIFVSKNDHSVSQKFDNMILKFDIERTLHDRRQ